MVYAHFHNFIVYVYIMVFYQRYFNNDDSDANSSILRILTQLSFIFIH